jgi:hypothetical protein
MNWLIGHCMIDNNLVSIDKYTLFISEFISMKQHAYLAYISNPDPWNIKKCGFKSR